MHPRRYYLLQALFEKSKGADAAWFTLRGQQQALAGTALPTTIVRYDLLTAAGYLAYEDVRGARADELMKTAGLNRREADAVLAAVGA